MATNVVMLGSARIDENGHAKGGKAGDQTGKEVSTQKWYLHSKGWRVFRAIDSLRADKIAADMRAACNNSNIGYDQNQRNTLYNIAKDVGFDCAKVKTKCETDCSALVRVCCAYAGIMLPNFRTSTEANTLLKSGYFTEMKGDKYQKKSTYLRAGDILVTKTQGHTVVVLNNGPDADIKPSDATRVYISGNSVNIREKPMIDCKIVGIAHKGDLFPYSGETIDDHWNKIIYKGEFAYVSTVYSYLVV